MQVLLPRLSRSSRGDKAAAQRERGPADFTQNRNRFTQNLPLQTHVVAGTSYLAMQSRLIRTCRPLLPLSASAKSQPSSDLSYFASRVPSRGPWGMAMVHVTGYDPTPEDREIWCGVILFSGERGS